MGRKDHPKGWLMLVVWCCLCIRMCPMCSATAPSAQSWSCPETTADLMDIMHLTIVFLGNILCTHSYMYIRCTKRITRASSWTSPSHGFVSQGLKRSNSWKRMPTLSLSHRFAMWMDTWLPGKAIPESYLWHLCSISSFETMGANLRNLHGFKAWNAATWCCGAAERGFLCFSSKLTTF